MMTSVYGECLGMWACLCRWVWQDMWACLDAVPDMYITPILLAGKSAVLTLYFNKNNSSYHESVVLRK